MTHETRPWTYWWWMASAVDETNITRQLEQFRDGGLGGVHVIPIYGAKGYEDRSIEYLSPKWLQMLAHTVSEARRLGMDVDMTTGSGWCFGGPGVSESEANASVQVKRFEASPERPFTNLFESSTLQCLIASDDKGQVVDLTPKLSKKGALLDWSPGTSTWQVFAISQRPSGQKVKRAGHGGQGHMLNPFYDDAVKSYVRWFDQAFEGYRGPKPRAMYHDSYEYRSDWSPDLFEHFAKLRGYRLETHIPVLFGGGGNPALLSRVRTDYRETLSDLMIDRSMPVWVNWSHRAGFITRNEAHGAPGNWLDLYGLADIPETEMFHTDRNKLISKFASSAAHVTGKRFTSAESGTWLKEHFTETLADMKYLLDDLFLSGVNHVVYHGTCYSPVDAPWPGWLFYASYEMNPRNSVWRDVDALNAYATRCQSVLQSGVPDNDILIYWPIHDFWNSATGLVRNMSVHARDWFEAEPIGRAAEQLWNRGYAFDYISDRQLQDVQVERGTRRLRTHGSSYQVVLIPVTHTMPETTLRRLLQLAEAGGTVIFQNQLPQDVPGLGRLDQRRKEFHQRLDELHLPARSTGVASAVVGRGRVCVGNIESALSLAGVTRETLADKPGLMAIRRQAGDRCYYFLANRSDSLLEGWIPLAKPSRYVYAMDPLDGRIGAPAVQTSPGSLKVWLRLPPGHSIILGCTDKQVPNTQPWPHWTPNGAPREIGPWDVRFISGGPELPAPFKTAQLGSWVTAKDPHVEKFAGTALYRTEFDLPNYPEPAETGTPNQHCWQLDLGQVCQSARVRLNGREVGALIVPPFRTGLQNLKRGRNVLEVEVTNVSANRIRALDREGVAWKRFHDINFVNINYKPFDAAGWPLTDSGLLGPVTLTPVQLGEPGN